MIHRAVAPCDPDLSAQAHDRSLILHMSAVALTVPEVDCRRQRRALAVLRPTPVEHTTAKF